MIKSNILYFIGLAIMLMTFSFKPYSKEYFIKTKKEIEEKLTKDVLDFNIIKDSNIETIKYNNELIVLYEMSGKNVFLNDIKELKKENFNLKKDLKIKYDKILIDELELNVGLSGKARINRIYMFGMLTIALFLMIIRIDLNKKENNG